MNAQIQAVFRRRKLTYTLLIAAVVGIYFFCLRHYKISFDRGCFVVSQGVCLDRGESDSG